MSENTPINIQLSEDDASDLSIQQDTETGIVASEKALSFDLSSSANALAPQSGNISLESQQAFCGSFISKFTCAFLHNNYCHMA